MRQIPEDKPLSAEDRQWLTDWGRFDQIKRIDEANGPSNDDTPEKRIPESDLRSLLRDVGVEVGEDDDVLDAVRALASGRNTVPAEKQMRLGDSAAHVSPDDAANGGGDPMLSNAGDSDDDYDDWTNDELKEELGSRELSKSGNKGELVARLRESDEAGWGQD